jgi:hypothetical protein
MTPTSGDGLGHQPRPDPGGVRRLFVSARSNRAVNRRRDGNLN